MLRSIPHPPHAPPLLIRRNALLIAFGPKYDLIEHPDSFALYGELPDVEPEDLEIKFTNHQTINICGRTKRSYTSSTLPVGLIERNISSDAISEGDEASGVHERDVQDTQAANAETPSQPSGAQRPQEKYLLSERWVGEFSRSFMFHVSVDQDRVEALMKNGLLSIVIPKA
jgi:HSP20 family protein